MESAASLRIFICIIRREKKIVNREGFFSFSRSSGGTTEGSREKRRTGTGTLPDTRQRRKKSSVEEPKALPISMRKKQVAVSQPERAMSMV